MIEVIATPTRSPNQLIESLALNTIQPDLVTLVTNGNHRVDNYGLRVRLLRFSSDQYAVGKNDVALRCNVGVWSAKEPMIIFQGDDQVASQTMLEDSLAILKVKTHFWGHHRYTEFRNKSVADIMAQHPESGRSREQGVNKHHGYYSCYSGMLGILTDKIRSVGAFDMAFNCRHAGEDQHLGRRLDGTSVFIHEPPYSWHPEQARPWEDLGPTNTCDSHNLGKIEIEGYTFVKCHNCLWQQYKDEEERLYKRPSPLILYDHSKVSVREEMV